MSETVASRPLSRPLLAVVGAALLTVLGAILLWGYYGTTVFFETIRAGFVACFG
jgi:hypothetical protein